MNQMEMRSLIENAHRYNLERTVLVISKPRGWKLRGERIRTPFGNCEVASYLEKDGRVEIVFWAPVSKVLQFYRKMWPQDLNLNPEQPPETKGENGKQESFDC